ncbi:MFS transporter [Micromonospora humida]|uniref:MFS transporter n=1 Tax=Micromonospora humida TaxID=2809018 RepID=UPI003436EABC
MGGRYYLLLIASVTSSLGNWVYRLALPLLVLHLTGSALSTSLLYAIEYLPFLLLSLPGGVFADRWDRRRLLIAGDATAGVIALGLALLVVMDMQVIWPIYLVAFALSCVEPIYHPAFQSFLPQIVPANRLGQANGWLQSGENVTTMIGPVVAGGLIALTGFEVTILVNAVSFFVSALAILAIRGTDAVTRVARTARASLTNEIREALAYIFRKNKVLMAGSLMFTGTNFAIWLIQANFIFYLVSYRKLSPDVIGIVLAAQGVGAVLGAAVAGRLIRQVAPARVLIGTTALAGLVTLFLIPLHSPVAIAIVWGLLYALGSINPVAWFTLRQKIVPNELLGRVVATTRMLAFASIPVSAMVAGVIETTFHNFYLVIAIGALLRLLVAGLAYLSPLGASVRRLDPTTPVKGSAKEQEPVPAPRMVRAKSVQDAE